MLDVSRPNMVWHYDMPFVDWAEFYVPFSALNGIGYIITYDEHMKVGSFGHTLQIVQQEEGRYSYKGNYMYTNEIAIYSLCLHQLIYPI